MRPNLKIFVKILISLLILILYCDYLIFYVVQYNCDFPRLDPEKEDANIKYDGEMPVKVMVLADTHLLGVRHGHWFDKLRREWQMYRTFQTAMELHRPEIVFVLGDLTDEGFYSSEEQFERYVRQFFSLFKLPDGTAMYTTVGNHDIGFHYRISPYLNQRFIGSFDSGTVQIVSFRGNHFVLLNSMALEGDGCFLCRPAELQLTHIEKILQCAKGTFHGNCNSTTKLDKYSKPILMQHFPLYRQSDVDCDEPDSAPMPLKEKRFKERWDCLSQEATAQLLSQLGPRLAMSGHTHHGCVLPLPDNAGLEITVPSFSWRNKDNPSYSLLTVAPNNYAVYRCAMPKESTVIKLYVLGATTVIFWAAFSVYRASKKRKYGFLFYRNHFKD